MQNLINFQPHAKKIIDNMHKESRLSHAYIFSGEDGCAKEEMAMYFAAKLYCKEKEVCYTCEECQKIFKKEHINVYYVAPEGNSIKKEQIMQLQQEFSKTSLQSGKRVYIIKDAQTLNVQSANSMLKFIEEPKNDETYAIFLTNNIELILPTIRSRCVVINFYSNKKQLQQEIEKNENCVKYSKYLVELTNNINDAINLSLNEQFIEIMGLIDKYERINTKKDKIIFINDNKDFLDDILNVKMFIDILIIYYEDCLKSNKDIISAKDIMYNIELLIELRNKANFYIPGKTLINNLFLNIIK